MSIELPNSDSGLLGLLLVTGPLSVLEIADATQVTSTAIRYRLRRLMDQAAVTREPMRHRRGRPRYRYGLTTEGARMAGGDFPDAKIARWKAIYQNSDPTQLRQTRQRIAAQLENLLRPRAASSRRR
jgi:predicted ArsR family transcriptional regulator